MFCSSQLYSERWKCSWPVKHASQVSYLCIYIAKPVAANWRTNHIDSCHCSPKEQDDAVERGANTNHNTLPRWKKKKESIFYWFKIDTSPLNIQGENAANKQVFCCNQYETEIKLNKANYHMEGSTANDVHIYCHTTGLQ